MRRIHRFLFQCRQAKIERDNWRETARQYAGNSDYWRGRTEEAESRAADFRERYDFQWEMRHKAEDELDALAI